MDSWHKDPVGIGLGQGTYGLSHPKARRTWGRERSEMQSQKPLQTKTTRTTRTTQNSTGQFVNGSSASYHSLVALSICQHFFNTSTHTHSTYFHILHVSFTCHSRVISARSCGQAAPQSADLALRWRRQWLVPHLHGRDPPTSVTRCNESMIYQGN